MPPGSKLGPTSIEMAQEHTPTYHYGPLDQEELGAIQPKFSNPTLNVQFQGGQLPSRHSHTFHSDFRQQPPPSKNFQNMPNPHHTHNFNPRKRFRE